MALDNIKEKLISVVQPVIEKSRLALGKIISGLPPENACQMLRNGSRLLLMITIPSLLHAGEARGQEIADASVENGEDTLLEGHLGVCEDKTSEDASLKNEGCTSETAPDGKRKVTGTCVFFVPGANGNKFKLEFDHAEALLDSDLNVELKFGAMREISGTDKPPRITVCGGQNCMTADIDDVGWVKRVGEDQVEVKSEKGETLISTTYDTALQLKEGEWASIELNNPNGGKPVSCSIRWVGKSPENSGYLLASMASLLYLALLKRRTKKRK